MSADPSGFVRNPPSTYVKIINTARAEMNGQFGLVIGYSAERSRYVLLLTNSGSQAMLRPENLEPASTMEQYQAQYQQIRNDPRVQQKVTELYSRAQRALGGQKPEHAAAVVGILFLVLAYKIGFSKMIMLTSLILLLGIIVAPDVQSFGIKKWKLILRNFPNRCRETIEQTVPQARGRVTNQMAMGLVVLMLFMAGRTLLTSTAARPTPPPPIQASPQTSLATAVAIEDAYKLGYNDATAGQPFGTASLAALKEQVSRAGVTPGPDIDYDYPPPPRKSSGGFGFGSLMSLFVIGRTVMQSGTTVEGNFDPQLLVANLQLMPFPQKAMLGFSVFNLLRSFL